MANAASGKIVVLMPAHNEAGLIGAALDSLALQTVPADEIIVVADRCRDATVEIARAHRATILETVDNEHAKAGGLNQALATLLPTLDSHDSVLVMDADTTLPAHFIERASKRLAEPYSKRRMVGGVGGVFLGTEPVFGWVGHMQNNEYVRYAREIGRLKGRAAVLTGTATLFTVSALRALRAARKDHVLPTSTDVYDVNALTEDNELTLALKHLGYACVSPRECTVRTELPGSWTRLFYQRLRWQRGALENLMAYGPTIHTLPYIARQVVKYLVVGFLPFYLTALAFTFVTTGVITFPLFWIGVTVFIELERAWSVRKGGWKSIGLSLLVFPEIAFDVFLHCVYARAAVDIATHADESWGRPTSRNRLAGKRTRWRRSLLLTFIYVGLGLGFVVGLSLFLSVLGVVWLVVAALVLGGTAQAAIRLIGWDPLGVFLGSGENRDRYVAGA